MDMKQFIEAFASNHALTTQTLASALGYKSALTLERMLGGKTGRESARRFGQRIQQVYKLTEEEKLALNKAVQTALPGCAEDHSELEMWAFLQGRQLDPFDGVEAVIQDVQTEKRASLYECYAKASDIRITLFNCQYSPIFASLKTLLETHNTKVDHYISINDNIARTAHTINTVMQIFYEKYYKGYSRYENNQDQARGATVSDMLVCAYKDENGAAREDLLIFDALTHAHRYTRAGGGDAFKRMLGLSQANYHAFKRSYFDNNDPDNYIQHSIDYSKLEENRAIYKVKSDIGIDYVYSSILASAVREGPMPKNEQTDEMVNMLERVYADRVRNTFTKRKSAYTILKKNAMRRFAQTGKTSDHFWGMRPFTPSERVRILTVLINQQMKNPFFHLYFLRDDDAIRDVEVALYEDEGILMLESDTDYNLSAGHSEVMFSHREFIRLYKDFFMHHLIKHQVLPEEDTLRILGELIEECQRMES